MPVLYVEDEADDIFFMQRAFKQADIAYPLLTFSSGDESISYLDGKGAFSDRACHPLPVLVLLDINMPQDSGFEVLCGIRQRPSLLAMPVVVISSSIQEGDIQQAAQLGANGYLVKPGKPNELLEVLKAFKDYWLCPVCRPERIQTLQGYRHFKR